jgi:putative phosphotransacetylase
MAKILIETSARHVHVTQEVLEQLFGAGAQLTVKKELSQPGQFASEQKVTVLGPVNPKTGKQGSLTCSILGPVRSHNQVEVSFTDARTLGVKAPIRESGDVAGSAACTLVGPAGSVELSEGVIVAKRHIHMTPEDAEAEGVKNGDIVSVQVDNETGRNLVFQDTVVRVSKNYALAMHIDTDESNAGCLSGEVFGHIVK